jgi:hypothetical protein
MLFKDIVKRENLMELFQEDLTKGNKYKQIL